MPSVCAVMYARWNTGQDSLLFHAACSRFTCALAGNPCLILSMIGWNWKQAGQPYEKNFGDLDLTLRHQLRLRGSDELVVTAFDPLGLRRGDAGETERGAEQQCAEKSLLCDGHRANPHMDRAGMRVSALLVGGRTSPECFPQRGFRVDDGTFHP